ncbi:enzymatic polyprotein [Plakobranchus ocellatus]|uniref:Enzymatic polyprotein n=1 Tax=Plakobranchus ocellatus TaxID=259542 RepID=A0AAV3Y277_9GAST|nr:enzymatic polyprotein [Plakobranchus ocellatus]
MAFVTLDRHYEFLRMAFGKMNSGATLTRTVEMLVRGMDYVVDYVDALLLHTPSLGLIGCYKQFTPYYASISAPLFDLVHKGNRTL